MRYILDEKASERERERERRRETYKRRITAKIIINGQSLSICRGAVTLRLTSYVHSPLHLKCREEIYETCLRANALLYSR